MTYVNALINVWRMGYDGVGDDHRLVLLVRTESGGPHARLTVSILDAGNLLALKLQWHYVRRPGICRFVHGPEGSFSRDWIGRSRRFVAGGASLGRFRARRHQEDGNSDNNS